MVASPDSTIELAHCPDAKLMHFKYIDEIQSAFADFSTIEIKGEG